MLFDGWTGNDFTKLFASENEMEDCALAMLNFITVCYIVFHLLVLHIIYFFDVTIIYLNVHNCSCTITYGLVNEINHNP